MSGRTKLWDRVNRHADTHWGSSTPFGTTIGNKPVFDLEDDTNDLKSVSVFRNRSGHLHGRSKYERQKTTKVGRLVILGSQI
ncbi:hypothetical protein ABIF97_004252 [Bradyrhizobium japonicum]